MKNKLHLKKLIVKQLILCKYSKEFKIKKKHNFLSYFSESTSQSTNSVSQSRHPTIISLAKNYRIHYLQMIKEINGISSNSSEKRSLESPIMMTCKRSRSSGNSNNTLQTLRNRIQHEENEQFYFNDERRM